MCWEHDHIADITTALAPFISGGVVPGPWPSSRFDVVVSLTTDARHPGSFLCAQVPQLLLAGDSTSRYLLHRHSRGEADRSLASPSAANLRHMTAYVEETPQTAAAAAVDSTLTTARS